MKFAVQIFLSAVLVLSLAGCSTVMAARQPGKKDVSVFNKGTARGKVIAEIGSPIWSGEKDGKKCDIFRFTQGYHTATKVSRALVHGAADVFTLGLWEVVGTPTEAAFSGRQVDVEVIYDENDTVEKVCVHKGTEQMKKVDSLS
jgi:hypothetical protein